MYFSVQIISLSNQYNEICQNKKKEAIKEGRALFSCNHPNILKYIEEFQINFFYFILAEEYEQSLSDFFHINQSNVTYDWKLETLIQILLAIQYLHEKNYILKELNLKNIFLDEKKQIKLSQFTSVKVINQKSQLRQPQINNYIITHFIQFPHQRLEFPHQILEFQNKKEINFSFYLQTREDIQKFGQLMIDFEGDSQKDIQQNQETLKIIKKSYSIKINELQVNIQNKDTNQRLSVKTIIKQLNDIKINLRFENKLLNEALKQYNDFDFNSSIDNLTTLININPMNDQYFALLGQAYQELQTTEMIEKAMIYNEKSLEINPKNDLALSNLAYCYYFKKEYEISLSFIEQCLKINSQNYKALKYKGYIQQSIGNNDEAIKLYKEVLKIYPKDIPSLVEIGEYYLRKEQFNQALIYLKKAIKIQPYNYDINKLLGTTFFCMHEDELAIIYLKKAIQINSNSQEAFYFLGLTYQHKNMYDVAIQYFKKQNYIDQNEYCQEDLIELKKMI